MNSTEGTRRAGFTLVELMIVVAVMAVIAAMAVSRMSGIVLSAKTTAARSDLKTLCAAFVDPASGYMRDMRGIPGFSPAHLRLANLLIPTNVYGYAGNGGAWQGGFRVDDGPHAFCAPPETFTRWNAESGRGWRGPYVRHAGTAAFPRADGTRFDDDETFEARGFFPGLSGLRLPKDFLDGTAGCSIYGFPGEPAVFDPWGNPYVLQIPPPQAFPLKGGSNTNLPDEVRFRYARLVSAGPDGRLDTPCFFENATNWWATSWNERKQRLCRQAGLIDGNDLAARGDDIVLFLARNDVDEGERRE